VCCHDSSHVVHEFVAAIFIYVGIAAVDANGEDVAYLEVGLRSVGRKSKVRWAYCMADFISQVGGEGGGQGLADK